RFSSSTSRRPDMAEVVLGLGTSHGPMLVTETETWGARIPADKVNQHAWRGRMWSYDELCRERASENLEAQITREVWDQRQTRCQAAIERLADIFAAAKPDVAVIFG